MKRYKVLILVVLFLQIAFLFSEDNSSFRKELSPAEKDWIAQKHKVRVSVYNWAPYQMNSDKLNLAELPPSFLPPILTG